MSLIKRVTEPITLLPFNWNAHRDEFREQIAVLYPVGFDGDYVQMLRSWIHTCHPGRAGFDPENPGGNDTLRGWQAIDDMIDNKGVRGICHTHPADFLEFSSEDRNSQMGLAKANGKMFIWHVLHCQKVPETARVICQHMLYGQVITYDFGTIDCMVDSPVVLLPLPPKARLSDGSIVFEV